MSIFSQVSINPFEREELFTSYKQNTGEEFPAIVIHDTDKDISIYDGIMKVGRVEIRLDEYKIGELSVYLNSLGAVSKVYRGTENIAALMLVNFSNRDIIYTDIDRSPIDAGLLKSKSLISNVFDNYSKNVDVTIIQNGLTSIDVVNNKIYTSADDIGEAIASSHFAKTFMLKVSDKVLFRNYNNINKNPNVKDALITANIHLRGKDNAGYNL